MVLADRYGVSSDWLLFGEGRMLRRDDEGGGDVPADAGAGFSARPVLGVSDAAAAYGGDQDLVYVGKVRARLSAGGGSLETESEITGYYGFRSQWLRRKGQPGKMVLMDVSGDSMEPRIEDGDTALIDLSQTEIIPGRIYAVGIDEEVVVTRLDKLPGKIVLISENRRLYPPREVPAGEGAAVRILGRVIWWCRDAR